MIQIFKSTTLSLPIIVTVLLGMFRFEGYSRAVFVIDYILTLMMIGGARIFIRALKEYFYSLDDTSEKKPVLIMGAGDGGELLLREIRNNPKIRYRPVGFIDDDPKKKGKTIHGLEVLGSRDDLPDIVRRTKADKLIISIFSAEDAEFEDVFKQCMSLGIECKKIRPIIEM